MDDCETICIFITDVNADIYMHIHIFLDMDPSFFYGASGLCSKVVWQIEEALDSESAQEIIMLLPDSGDKDLDSDVENDSDFTEPAGELEVVEEVDGEDEWAASDSGSRWRKSFTSAFSHSEELHSENLEALNELYPGLVGKPVMELRRLFWDQEMLDHMLEQTLLYARRDKNEHQFNMDKQHWSDV